MRKLFLVVSIGLTALFTTLVMPAGAHAGTGTVTVVHGIPDLTVDVYVDGEVALEDFKPDTVTDPIQLPAGEHQLALRPANADADSAPALSGSATLPARANASIVAHLDAAGAPKLSVFVNDTSPVFEGKSRLVVRHTAAAPAVDVLAGGTPVFRNLANPNEAKADLPAGTVSAAVAATGTTTPVLGPVDLQLQAGTSTIVYAVGSLEGDTLKVLSQTIGGLGAADGTPAGNLPRTGSSETMLLVAIGLGLIAAGLVVARQVVTR